jgi:acetylornithine deacetylase/succinyl-diaminopimelate desuccinylase-like protein
MISETVPSITTGLRGISCLEVEVSGPSHDLHSGIYGGAVANPVNILCKMIASLHDESGKVKVKGFYDDVEIVGNEERNELAKAPFSLEEYKKSININEVWGETGYTTTERTGIRPALDVNGIWGGYTGEGSKTVIPAKAFAKISMRLVPNQDYTKIAELFKAHFESLAPAHVTVKVTPLHGGQGYVAPIDSPAYRAAYRAIKEVFKTAPVPFRSGGSIPVISTFEQTLGVKSILMGFGLESDAIHSPNENFPLYNLVMGIKTVPLFYKYFVEEYSKKK